MIVSMTNSTRGLGKELSKRFDNILDGWDVNSDVFINLRHNSFKQTEILMHAYNEWKYQEKTIVNVISRSKYPNISKGYLYSASKAALSHLSTNLKLNSDKKCRIIDVNPGLLESNLPSLRYSEVANVIEYCINLPFHIEIGEISVWHNTPYNIVSKLKDEAKN